MNAEHTFWTDRLSEALDGTLPQAQAQALEDHLASCAGCRRVRAELEEVRRRARALEPVEPARDLWLEIAPRLEAATLGDKVIPMHGHRLQEPPAERRRLRLSLPQAAAAALVLAFGGALTGSLVQGPVPEGSTVAASDPGTRAILAASDQVPPALFEELHTLEASFRADLSRLDPETRDVIVANLEIIDRAIRESVRALQSDPGSHYLQGHLGDALQRKVGYLQQVTRLLET
jgi:hypothetical protein